MNTLCHYQNDLCWNNNITFSHMLSLLYCCTGGKIDLMWFVKLWTLNRLCTSMSHMRRFFNAKKRTGKIIKCCLRAYSCLGENHKLALVFHWFEPIFVNFSAREAFFRWLKKLYLIVMKLKASHSCCFGFFREKVLPNHYVILTAFVRREVFLRKDWNCHKSFKRVKSSLWNESFRETPLNNFFFCEWVDMENLFSSMFPSR